ncbi:GNAT family N-acetyltransferase [Streptoalloteichus hindustanus]|uniref:Acetyltransferase (GNAT) family protein n=1 Tax=Streptoalloteichus hindustanus TaxID=2017 RepID=A0A1M4UNB2_STRHI|nr:GNAT family N-acetyltransferase [Streptoalloteichus hindustanus]SHE58145.1 Acetyltransferase (GNAT) family protein [Streptoalloteichus hindustanus]
MIRSLTNVRIATADDLPAIAETLADAFDGNAWTRWTVAADDHRQRIRALQLLHVEKLGLPFGRVWVAQGGSAVAVWMPPEPRVPEHVWAELGPRVEELQGERASFAAAADVLCEAHKPAEPHWWLATVGVRPDLQGRGLGTAALKAGLVEVDRSGQPAFLETSDERNVRLYQRLGFEVTAELDIPGGGPHTWFMRREPGTTHRG